MKILIIEDNKDILANIADYLEADGYIVDCAQDGLSGLHLAVSQQFDLIILDILLPGIDGFQLCKRLRSEAKIETPIIMLTAKDGLNDRLEGLKSGADDYLVKPFALSELGARIKAVYHRASGRREHILKIGSLSYDLDALEVRRGSILIKMNPIGLKLLEILMKKSPSVVRRNILEEYIWGDSLPDSDSLRTHMHQLRNSIDKSFDDEPLLQTVHGIGYRLSVPSLQL